MTPALPITIFDAIVLLVVAVPFAVLVRSRHAIPLLPAAPEPASLPRLSVVVPARDEALAIGRALASLLAQDYSDLEIIVVDDRSADATGEVAQRLATKDSRVRVIRVDDVPAGWLGKNHALWRAYQANDPTSTRGVGVGAFNLIRRDAYEKIGTMRALSLRPDDDIRLGRRLRAFGFRQRVLNGNELLSVEWYPSLRAAIAGLEKSLYSSLEYRVVDAVAVIVYLVATLIWPFVGILVLGGLDRVLLATVVACLVAALLEIYRQAIAPLTPSALIVALLLPFSAACFVYAIVRSVYRAETRGVSWRGTTYPLALLRAQSGLEGTAANRRR